MTMSDILYMILTLIIGMALGSLFFGGLWFTVKKAVTAKYPAIWFFVSFISRVSIVLIGFYYVSQAGWQHLLICLLGFIAARFLVVRTTRSIEQKLSKKENYYEA
jgi:F1F0 ATPase subunit 2